MTIARMRVTMSGAGVVGPGLMTFYSRNLTPSLPASVLKFLNSLQPAMAGGVIYTVPNQGDTIDEATGTLMGAWTGAGGGTVTAPSAGAYQLGGGSFLTWNTGAVHGGHRVKGRTFLAPLLNANFDSTGRVAAATAAGWQTAGATLITDNGGDLVVWSRPRKAGSGKNGNLPALAGAAYPITSCTSLGLPTALRSRRT